MELPSKAEIDEAILVIDERLSRPSREVAKSSVDWDGPHRHLVHFREFLRDLRDESTT